MEITFAFKNYILKYINIHRGNYNVQNYEDFRKKFLLSFAFYIFTNILKLFVLQVAGKREPEQELQAQQWIESIIGERFPNVPYEYALRDGIILCKLMNRLAPGIISRINTTGGDYKLMDNINQYV